MYTRTVRFSPDRKGLGPTFTLTLRDKGRLTNDCIGYKLTMRDSNRNRFTLFEAWNYRPAPGYAWDSDESVAALMRFLTLRPGDTDKEYFARYTPRQLEYCQLYAESLAAEVAARFDGVEA